jgi:hypothetical protein
VILPRALPSANSRLRRKAIDRAFTNNAGIKRTKPLSQALWQARPGRPWVRAKTAPHRGQVLALAEIIAPHARHEVILVTTFRDFLGTGPSLQVPVGD